MLKVVLMAACLVASAWICSCVKVHTDNTAQETGLTSEYKADKIREDWKIRIQNASPVEKAELLVGYFEAVTSMYFEIGYQTIDNWRALERKAGRKVESSEAQAMIDRWHEANRAYITAHDENVEYAARQIRFDAYYAESLLAHLDSLLGAYRRIRDAVLRPSGLLADYEFAFRQLEFEVVDIVQEYRERLKLR